MPGDDRAALLLDRCVSGCGLPRRGLPLPCAVAERDCSDNTLLACFN